MERSWLGFELVGGGHEDSAVGAAISGGDGVGQGAARPSVGVGARKRVEVVALEVGFGDGDDRLRAEEEVGAVFDAAGSDVGEVQQGAPVSTNCPVVMCIAHSGMDVTDTVGNRVGVGAVYR